MTTIDPCALPSDVESLKRILIDEVSKRDQRIAQLEHENRLLRRHLFEPRSERRPMQGVDLAQRQGALLFPELLEAAERVADRTGQRGSVGLVSAGTTTRRPRRRSKFPAHLPRMRTTYELPIDARTCLCGSPLHEIGEELSTELERLEVTVVHEIARKKYACRQCEEVVRTAPGPDRVIGKGLLGAGFLAHLIVERFGHHMPYHRLEKKYASEGLDLSRSVLCTSSHTCGELLYPIWIELRRGILEDDITRTDDTPVIVQCASDGRSRKARVWVYLGLNGEHVYDYTESRARDGPARFLEGYQGYLQADALNVYDPFYGPEKATEVACWAHTRRGFVKAEESEPRLAAEAVRRIGELYAIERVAKERELDADGRRTLRQQESMPLLVDLGDWLQLTRPMVLDKSPMAAAIDYALRQWIALNRYCEDGRLEIDNNDTERALRQGAVGRKNWIFVGNDNGGRTAAVLYSLVMTAKAVGIDPRVYLRDVLLRIAHETDVAKLTPQGWKVHFAHEVEQHRMSIFERLLEPAPVGG